MTDTRRDLVYKTFGRRLAFLRDKAGFNTAKEFADILGVDPHRYRHWERGHSGPDFDMLLRICQLLNTTPDFLLLGKIK